MTALNQISVRPDNPRGEVASQLLRELSADIARRYSDLGDDGSGAFSPGDALVPRSAFVVARLDGRPVGCGSLRPMDAETAEVKRMYVAPEGAAAASAGKSWPSWSGWPPGKAITSSAWRRRPGSRKPSRSTNIPVFTGYRRSASMPAIR